MGIGWLLEKFGRRKEREAEGTEGRASPKPSDPDERIGPDGRPIWWHKSIYGCANVVSMPPEEARKIHGKEVYHPWFGRCVAQQHHILKDAVTFMPKALVEDPQTRMQDEHADIEGEYAPDE